MLIFNPFIWLIKVLYAFNLALWGSHGWSLVFLSLEITLLMLPLYYLAEKWKRQEETDQNRMEGALNSVKEAYSGQKRYYLIREVHRIYGYKTLYSLRVTLGLIIQIPLFMAAYVYLSAYPGYAGVAFGPLTNLAAQDHLLRGINIMPFLMTAVNLVASFLYARGSKRSDKVQLTVMALLFLALLYDRPSGLVLYWTMNNLFGLPKNLWLKKVCPPAVLVEEEPLNLHKMRSHASVPWVTWGTSLTLFFLELSLLDKFHRTAKIFTLVQALLGLILTVICAAVWFIRRRRKKEYSPLILPLTMAFLWIVFAYTGYDIFFGGLLEMTFMKTPLRAFMLLLQFFITGLSLHYFLALPGKSTSGESPTSLQKALYFLTLGVILLFYFLLSPVNIYAGAASDLQTPIGRFIGESLMAMVPFLLLGLGAFWLVPGKRLQLLQFSVFLVLGTICYYYLLPSNFGLLDGNVLSFADKLTTIPEILYFFDAALLLILLWVSGKIIRISPRSAFIIIISLLVGLCGDFAFKLMTTDFEKTGVQSLATLPPESEMVNGFSRTEPNVLLFVADMFNGGYMEYLKEDIPEVLKDFEGFTWYPNTLSISYYTVSSLPAILAGNKFSPRQMNKMPGSNRGKMNEAYYEVLIPLAKKGWNVSLTDPHQRLFGEDEKLITQTYASRYYPCWKSLTGFDKEPAIEAKESTMLIMFGIFHSVPYSLKNTVYSDGNWILIPKNAIKAKLSTNVRKMWAYMDLLPRISHAEETAPTFKYIHSYLTHMPFDIDKDGNILTEGYPDQEAGNSTGGKAAYYSAKEFMKLFAAYINWMKKEGVYDNTIILLLSDHGNFTADDDPSRPEGIDEILESDFMFNRIHSLLFFKGLNRRGEPGEDDTLMSNADAMELISRELDWAPEGTYQVERPLTFSYIADNYMMFPQESHTDYQVWQVKDSIFDRKNWVRMENE